MLMKFGQLISATEIDINQFPKLAEIPLRQKPWSENSTQIIFADENNQEAFKKVLKEFSLETPSEILIGLCQYALVIYRNNGKFDIFLLAAAVNK